MNWILLPVWGFLFAVLCHAFLSRIAPKSSRVLIFIGVASLVLLGVVFMAAAEYGLWSSNFLAVIMIYAAACELYIFLFTFVMSSISANVLVRLKVQQLSTISLKSIYNGRMMASQRVERLIGAKFAVEKNNLMSLTQSGNRLAKLFSVFRGMLHPVGKPLITKRIDFGNIFLVVIFFAVLIFPLFYFEVTGTNLAHIFEETVGYRYFYSLRIAYGDEYPWLPQGQLLNIVFVIVQWVLTFVGYPVDQLFPRIHAFIILGALVPLILSACAYYVLCKYLNSLLLRVIVGVVFALTIYNSRSLFFEVVPEYIAWVLPIAITSLIYLVRLSATKYVSPTPYRSLILFGMFCGVCASVKISLLAFPLAVSGVYAIRCGRKPLALLLNALLVGTVTLITTYIILLAAFGFSFASLDIFFVDIVRFFASQSDTLPQNIESLQWLRNLKPESLFDVAPVILVLPVVLLVMGVTTKSFRGILGILPASAASIAFYAERPYFVTYNETFAFAALSLAFVAIMIGRRIPNIDNLKSRIISYSGVFACCFIGVLFIKGHMLRLDMFAKASEGFTVAHEEVTRHLSKTPGATALFAIDNNHRMPSIESGFCKGATEIFNMTWSDNRYLARLFPERICYYFAKQSVDTRRFNKALITSVDPNETAIEAVRKVENFFSVDLSQFNCKITVPYRSSGEHYHICEKITVNASSFGKGTPMILKDAGRWYVASDNRSDIYLDEVTTSNPEGRATIVEAKSGETLKILNVGKVEVGTQKPLGLEGTFYWTRWLFPLREWNAANVNPVLELSESGKQCPKIFSPTGYWVSPLKTDATFTQERDQTGDFIRMLSTKENSYLGLTGQDPMRQAMGQPISLKIDIRVPHSREVVASIYDVLDSNGEAQSSSFAFNAPAGEWVTIVLRAPAIAFSSPSDHYAIGLSNVKAGDYFDLREISVFEGIIP